MNELENKYSLVPTWLKVSLTLGLLLSVLWLSHSHLFELLAFFRDRAAVEAYLERVGLWGPLLYLLLLGLQVLTVIMPGHILMLTAGYLYGFGGGLSLNIIGTVGASQLAFMLSRWAGKPWVQRLVPAALFERWHILAQRQGFLFYLLCFLFPIIPGNVTNYLGGLSLISFWLFFLANLLGRLPGLIIITFLGAYGVDLTWQQWLLIAAAGVFLVAGGRYFGPKLTARFTSA
jgi:uncharacterized membrane protein YdjX (TVP38/TMEM64 family)